jgi:hypothetical protein
MRRWLARALVTVAALASVVAGCLRVYPPLAFCPDVTTPGPAALTDGPVTLGTNQSTYALDTPLQIILTNHLNQSVWVMPPYELAGSRCNPYAEQWVHGLWRAYFGNCGGDARPPYPSLYHEFHTGDAGTSSGLTPRQHGLDPSTYRIGYSYSLTPLPPGYWPNGGDAGARANAVDYVRAATQLYSPPFRVCGCGECGPVKWEWPMREQSAMGPTGAHVIG